VQSVSYQQFKILLQNPDIMFGISQQLIDKHGLPCSIRGEVQELLTNSDKDLFTGFRDNKITYDQLKARVAERMGVAKYKVLDDFVDKLHPSIMEGIEGFEKTFQLMFKGKSKITVADLLRPREDWEMN